MLCLAYFIPGKAGVVIRRILLFSFIAAILYLAVWILTLKGLKIETKSQGVENEMFFVNLLVTNKAFFPTKINNIDFYNDKDEKVYKKTEDLPAKIKPFGTEEISLLFKLEQYETVEMEVETMFKKLKHKNSLVN